MEKLCEDDTFSFFHTGGATVEILPVGQTEGQYRLHLFAGGFSKYKFNNEPRSPLIYATPTLSSQNLTFFKAHIYTFPMVLKINIDYYSIQH
jgi:hypothetical protein